MFRSISTSGALGLTLILLASSTALSQSYQDTDYRKVSFSVYGGASLGDMNQNDYFMSSNFSTNIENSFTLGAGVQYALTPAWSLEGGYQYAQIRGRSIPFETSLNLITLKNIFNLNQIFSINQISDRINPYVTAGFGYDFFNYNGPDNNFNNHNSSYNAGFGIAYKLSNAIDLFTHYEYHLASNATDNVTEGYGSDLINSLTGGIRINFGKKKAKHLSWRAAPIEISPSEYNRFMTQAERVDSMEQRINAVAQQQKEREQEFEQTLTKKSAQIDSLRDRLKEMDKQTEELKKSFADYREKVTRVDMNDETGFAEVLPSGHYVQVFASYKPDIAHTVRKQAFQSLKSTFIESEENIFVIERKQFYEVLIGVFSDYESAQNIQEVMVQIHDDAYVITFPRPVNLQPDFEDLEVLEDRPLVNILK